MRTAGSIGRIVAPATEPMSPVMRDRGLGRRLDVFDLPLDDLRRASKATEGSLNDVFVAAVVGGLQSLPRAPRRLPGVAPDDAADQPPTRGRRLRGQSLRARALRRSGDDHRSARARAGDPRAGPTVARRARARAHRAARGRAQPLADRHHDRAVRRHVEVLRLRGHQRARRAGAGVRGRRARRAACTRSRRPRARP